MRRLTWAVVVAAGIGLTSPARGWDPIAEEEADPGKYEADAAAEASQLAKAAQPGNDTRSEPLVEEVRTGAGSMEPGYGETREQRSERVWVESIWTSP
jgi:hypothetical protein